MRCRRAALCCLVRHQDARGPGLLDRSSLLLLCIYFVNCNSHELTDTRNTKRVSFGRACTARAGQGGRKRGKGTVFCFSDQTAFFSRSGRFSRTRSKPKSARSMDKNALCRTWQQRRRRRRRRRQQQQQQQPPRPASSHQHNQNQPPHRRIVVPSGSSQPLWWNGKAFGGIAGKIWWDVKSHAAARWDRVR